MGLGMSSTGGSGGVAQVEDVERAEKVFRW